MIKKHNKYKLFKSKNLWILTKDKISSSWLKTEFDYVYIDVDIDSETFLLSIDSFDMQLNNNSFLTQSSYLELKNEFTQEWNTFIKGNDVSRDFLFLIRNPIHKFISGWIQDNIMRKIYQPYFDEEKERLKNYFTSDLVDDFFDYITNLPQIDFALHIFPDIDSLPIIYKDIYEEFVLPNDHIFFNQDTHKLFDTMLDGHAEQDLFIIWKLLFKESFDTSKLRILDIDMQDLDFVLTNQYNISLNKNNVYKHIRGKYLRNKAYQYLSKHHTIINNILNLQLFFWFEIICKIYPKELYEQLSLTDGIKSISSYKNRYFMPDIVDFYSIYTHFNWFQFKPDSVFLNYTHEK